MLHPRSAEVLVHQLIPNEDIRRQVEQATSNRDVPPELRNLPGHQGIQSHRAGSAEGASKASERLLHDGSTQGAGNNFLQLEFWSSEHLWSLPNAGPRQSTAQTRRRNSCRQTVSLCCISDTLLYRIVRAISAGDQPLALTDGDQAERFAGESGFVP